LIPFGTQIQSEGKRKKGGFKMQLKECIVTPDRYYNMNEQDKEFYISQVKDIIKDNTLLKRMENIVKRYVKAYQQDFYIHDIFSLVNNNSEFIWMVRKTGTDLIIKNGHCISKEGNWTGKLWFNAIKNQSEHFYHYHVRKSIQKMTSRVYDYNAF
jgi:hypothetical protein